MISFNFDYYRPTSVEEAVEVYKNLKKQSKKAIYYSGGTEIISLSRIKQMYFNAVIDIKSIPECNVLKNNGSKLHIGSAINLTKICDSNMFPLLGSVCRRIAEHTARDKITIGGNICGKTPYREAILPFLLTDCMITIAGENGTCLTPIMKVFDKTLMLKDDEFILNFIIEKSLTSLPFKNMKKTKQERIDYPLVSMAAINVKGEKRVAISGLCPHPFRYIIKEDMIDLPIVEQINDLLRNLPSPISGDILGSAGYKEFVARNTLKEVLS